MSVKNEYLSVIQALPKSDLHSHAGRGGNISYISKYYKVDINPPQHSFIDLSDMQNWFENNVKTHCVGIVGYLKRIEAAFVQAKDDNIQILAMSFGKGEIDFLGGIESFVSIINQLHNDFSPLTEFFPELALGREQKEEEILSWLDEILEYGWFKSIDICNNELAQPIKNFAKVYHRAAEYHLRLKAHVGEFGSADDVMEAVETLHLHEVHHGIAAADSVQVMKWLANHQIQLNVCPTSNIMLLRATDYKTHPIRALFDYEIPVTINTDDMLIFNSSVSQEYNSLFLAGAFDCDELEKIRVQGLLSEKLHQNKE